MSENSKIEWTHHTFNGWWGCKEVHAGCANCYAREWDRRWDGAHWGKDSPRRMILGEWSKPAKWNRAAKDVGQVHRVFCSSMCDIFEAYQEDRPLVDQLGHWVQAGGEMADRYKSLLAPGDYWTVPALRARIFDIIAETPNLLWLLLTKRPENVVGMVPGSWRDRWPANVMTGTSPCDQTTADKCIPALLKVPGRHFLSAEPLIGPLDLYATAAGHHGRDITDEGWSELRGIDWVIVGGESGPGARPCDVAWIRSVVEQCKASGVPVFVKQLGAHVLCRNDHVDRWMEEIGGGLDYFDEPEGQVYQGMPLRMRLRDRKGGDPAEWPSDLRVREFPQQESPR